MASSLVAPLRNDPRLVFDAESHRYHLEGRELVSVTAALTAAGMVDTQYFTDEARVRGSYVHQAIALLAEGALDETSIDPTVAPYVDAARQFLADTGVELEHVEARVCDPLAGYAGTLDAIARWPGPIVKRTVLDWKSGGCPPSAGPQTAAYLRCARDWYPAGTRIGRAGLHLRGDGTYRLVDFPDVGQDEQDFLAALRVALFQRRYALDGWRRNP